MIYFIFVIMKYYVYLHKKASDGTPFYVGKGCRNRAYSKSKRSDWWRNTVNKHGYEVIILEYGLSESVALEREKYWIKFYGRQNQGTGPLVNITPGGYGGGTFYGRKHTDETRKKMSEWQIGKKHSDKTKKKISKSVSNFINENGFSEERNKKISKSNSGYKNGRSRIIIDLETGVFYMTIKEAAYYNGIKYSSLKNYLQGTCKNKTKLEYA